MIGGLSPAAWLSQLNADVVQRAYDQLFATRELLLTGPSPEIPAVGAAIDHIRLARAELHNLGAR